MFYTMDKKNTQPKCINIHTHIVMVPKAKSTEINEETNEYKCNQLENFAKKHKTLQKI